MSSGGGKACGMSHTLLHPANGIGLLKDTFELYGPFLFTTVNFISDQREREKRCSATVSWEYAP